MNTPISFKAVSQADIDKHIALARQIRSEYVNRSVKSGFAQLRSLFSLKSSTVKVKS